MNPTNAEINFSEHICGHTFSDDVDGRTMKCNIVQSWSSLLTVAVSIYSNTWVVNMTMVVVGAKREEDKGWKQGPRSLIVQWDALNTESTTRDLLCSSTWLTKRNSYFQPLRPRGLLCTAGFKWGFYALIILFTVFATKKDSLHDYLLHAFNGDRELVLNEEINQN